MPIALGFGENFSTLMRRDAVENSVLVRIFARVVPSASGDKTSHTKRMINSFLRRTGKEPQFSDDGVE